MKKKVIVIILILLIILAAISIVYWIDQQRMNHGEEVLFSTWGKEYTPKTITKNINIALSLEDEIKEDTAWCGTFNLIWNDLKNNLAKQDIIFIKGQPKIVDNLNKGTFTSRYLSESSYYKVCDIKSIELKKKIEKTLKINLMKHLAY